MAKSPPQVPRLEDMIHELRRHLRSLEELLQKTREAGCSDPLVLSKHWLRVARRNIRQARDEVGKTFAEFRKGPYG